MYFPIFAAAPGAQVFGAGLTRDEAGAAMQGGFDAAMGGETAIYGLDVPLPEDQQMAREALQMAAHCDRPQMVPMNHNDAGPRLQELRSRYCRTPPA